MMKLFSISYLFRDYVLIKVAISFDMNRIFVARRNLNVTINTGKDLLTILKSL